MDAQQVLQQQIQRRLSITSYEKIEEVVCICYQERSNITCPWCDFQTVGRVRRKCRKHPNVIHLMDFIYCPQCRGTLK